MTNKQETRNALGLILIALLILAGAIGGCQLQSPIRPDVGASPCACPTCAPCVPAAAAYDTSSTTTFTNLAATGTLAISGATTLASTLEVTGASTLTGAVTVGGGYGDTGCTISAAGVLECNGAGTFDGVVTAAGVQTTLTVLGKTADYTITTGNTGDLITTTNAITLTLPAAAVGLNYCIFNGDGNDIVIAPDSSDQIHTLTNAAGDRLTNTTVGDSICLVAIDGVYWAALERVGTWSDGN
jgi:hypothetical protein